MFGGWEPSRRNKPHFTGAFGEVRRNKAVTAAEQGVTGEGPRDHGPQPQDHRTTRPQDHRTRKRTSNVQHWNIQRRRKKDHKTRGPTRPRDEGHPPSPRLQGAGGGLKLERKTLLIDVRA